MAVIKSDLERAFDAIKAKQRPYDHLLHYYDGEQPTVYLTERLRRIFAGVDVNFAQNWCSVVIDACRERINMRGFSVKNEATDKLLATWWDRLQLQLESDDVHTYAMIYGEAVLIIWPSEDADSENDMVDVYFNDPSMVHVFYKADRPKEISFAGKLYEGEDGLARMTLYYEDRLEYYVAPRPIKDVSSWKAFKPDVDKAPNGVATHEYGIVPLFHFRVNRRQSSDLKNVVPVQNGINKLLSDMMVAAEYGAFRQRWVISDADVQGKLTSEPGSVWQIPPADGEGQNVSAGEFSATDLGNYLKAVEQLASAIAAITRTPKHYFFAQNGTPSGEALIAMEAPLNKKAQDHIDRFLPVWRKAGTFLCKLLGIDVIEDDLTPLFDKPETVQPKTQADITKVRRDSGVPLVTALQWEGKSEEEIGKMLEAKRQEDTERAATLASALVEKERMLTRNEGNDGRPTKPGETPKTGVKRDAVQP